ncbi:MAG: pyruvate, phosphate dikinase [Nonomuraea sp.]|nr:pyruvate, phosphate dikinase [Nonomuraea sp.]
MYTLPLNDPRADLATAGGKGESLARLAAAGLPVPPGFHLTTDAYRAFVAANGLTGSSDRERFTAGEIPADLAEAILAAYAPLGEAAVAVRSSATAEDLPGMSFAGQQDTFLNVRGDQALLDAVRRCWASLWTERAIAYRERNGIAHDQVALAVVVQELVEADTAGVMFTEEQGNLIVNAAFGLGEAVVGGLVTPDTYTVDRDGPAVVDEQISDKSVMTVRTQDGTREVPVPRERRESPALSTDQVTALAGLGLRIERLYGRPMDVEWAFAGGEPYILQARPITGQREVWNDTLRGDYLWSNGNAGEAIPSVMTPATWSLVQRFMTDIFFVADIVGHPMFGNIGGRFYMNLSPLITLGGAIGSGARVRKALVPIFGKLPDGLRTPLLPISRWQAIRAAMPLIKGRLAMRKASRRVPAFVASARQRSEDLRARIATSDDLGALWEREVAPYFTECTTMLGAAGRQDAGSLVFLDRELAALVGEADANALISSVKVGDSRLESLGPLLGLARLRRGEITREEYARQYGHRCPDEFEISVPRPAEDPAWIDKQLDGLTIDPADLLRKQDEASDAAWRRFRDRDPKLAAKYRRRILRWGEIAGEREGTRSEVIRAFWVLRDFVRRAGELTGRGDDLFFLTIQEILQVLRGDQEPLVLLDRRRAAYDHYRSLPNYPGLIRGRFDPDRWAADPERRSDVFDATASVAAAATSITGFPGAAGVVEGTARVITSVADGERLGEGEIRVTTVTIVGWTPLFPRAAAVVTDVGAPLSHATIVARELGIPAVVGTGNATMRIHDGDRVRVDGGSGTVEVVTVSDGERRDRTGSP